jgi:hypothetical protein
VFTSRGPFPFLWNAFSSQKGLIMNSSPARLEANRANAQLSTGPATPEGKAKSSLNAVKTGLTARAVLLSPEDAIAYQQHLDRHFTRYAPATDDEKSLVQSIADTEWRLLRIAPLEAGIYALGRRKLAHFFEDEQDPAAREALIQAEVFIAYRKDLGNLALQERRLRNQRAADVAQLMSLQKERLDKRAQDFKRAEKLYKSAQSLGIPFDPAYFGFVFSVQEIEAQMIRDQPDLDAYVAQWKARQAAA